MIASCAIAVMAKAPRPGHSKTRLVPPLTYEQAAALGAAFLLDTTGNIIDAARQASIAAYVAYAPAGHEAMLEPHLAPGTSLVLADGAIDCPGNVTGFGRCLLHAIRALLDAGHGSACVLNADGPTLPTAILRRTAALLAAPGDRAVLGPAEDGGYYLLGLKQAHATMFADIAWSTDNVASATRARARSIGLDLIELPPWYDVDDASALNRLLTEMNTRGEGYPAPATRRCLERLALLAPNAHA